MFLGVHYNVINTIPRSGLGHLYVTKSYVPIKCTKFDGFFKVWHFFIFIFWSNHNIIFIFEIRIFLDVRTAATSCNVYTSDIIGIFCQKVWKPSLFGAVGPYGVYGIVFVWSYLDGYSRALLYIQLMYGVFSTYI